MRKMLVFLAVLVAFALGMLWANRTKSETPIAVAAPTKIEAPVTVKSARELQMFYASVELTPTQKKLVAAGFSPNRFHTITTKTIK